MAKTEPQKNPRRRALTCSRECRASFGNEVAERCSAEKVKKGAGAPRLDGSMPARGNGWAAASEPRTGRIVGMLALENPENYN